MSALRILATRRTPYFFAQRSAAFHTSRARAAGKESTLHNEGRAEEVEEKKQDSLNKQKQGKGSWEEGLASDSESIIKADRDETKTTAQTIKKLQEEAEKVAHKKL